jgi:transcriptional regulator with XRE-family HTH domain
MPKRRNEFERKLAQQSRERFKRNIKQFREELGLSRDEAAARIGISSQYLYMLERGKRSIPSFEVLKDIANAYGRRVDELDVEHPPPANDRLFPSIRLHVLLSKADAQLVAKDLMWAIREFERIDTRLRERLEEEKAKLTKPQK